MRSMLNLRSACCSGPIRCGTAAIAQAAPPNSERDRCRRLLLSHLPPYNRVLRVDSLRALGVV